MTKRKRDDTHDGLLDDADAKRVKLTPAPFDTRCLWHDVRSTTASDWRATLDTYGVAVLTHVLPGDAARQHCTAIVDWLCSLTDGLTREPTTWTFKRMPYGPRAGMMQSLISHCPTVWRLRETVYPIFAKLWGTDDLITSLDGATVYPPIPARKNMADWPHVDQTLPEPPSGEAVRIGQTALCYQGQVVLTDTTASFRCSPKSHHLHSKLVALHDVKPSASAAKAWLRLNCPNKTATVRDWVQSTGGAWQVPIHAPAGSVILWRSSTIHSAQRVERLPTQDEIDADPWAGWRCAVYICQRPRSHFTAGQLMRLRKAALAGRTTVHWATRMFPLKAGAGRHTAVLTKEPKLEALSLAPDTLVKNRVLTPLQKRLVNL